MLRRLQRAALARAGGPKAPNAWLVVAAVTWLLRTALRLSRPVPEVVYRGELKPGESLVIDHTLVDREGKHHRKRSRRARR